MGTGCGGMWIGGVCAVMLHEVSYMIWVMRGGSCEVGYMRWITQGGLHEVGHVRWIRRGGLREVY